MLVLRVMEFIVSLSTLEEQLCESDLKYLQDLKDWFATKQTFNLEDTHLQENDLQWLQQIFADRWDAIFDKNETNKRDYTFDPEGINLAWVSFAKDLSLVLKKHFLLILIPVLINEVEPNNRSKLSEVKDPRQIYIGKDKKTWHRLKVLGELADQKPAVFAIRDSYDKGKPRPLNLDELYRIRSKRDLLINGELSSSCWYQLIQQNALTWKNHGSYSRDLFSTLLVLIEKYYQAKNAHSEMDGFNEYFNFFKIYLEYFSLQEVNYLYGIKIPIKEKPVLNNIDVLNKDIYLVDILLDCKENKCDLANKLLSLGTWLVESDPALSSKVKGLEELNKDSPFYTKKNTNFDLRHVYKLVNDLQIDEKSVVYRPYQELKFFLKQQRLDLSREVQQEIIDKLKNIYFKRGRIIIDTCLDFMRMQDKENLPWFQLVQYLVKVQLIDSNYYKWLLPGLEQDIEPVTKRHVTDFSLSKYVLSTNGKKLILLENSERHYEQHGTYFNCSENPPVRFSDLEKRRIAYANPLNYKFFTQIKEKFDDPPINIRTVNEIRKLVNGILSPEGQIYAKVSKKKYELANISFVNFIIYREFQASVNEKNRLDNQTIVLNHCHSVRDLLILTQDFIYERNVCISHPGEYFAQLVLHYDPFTLFCEEIENGIPEIAVMRRNSAKKLYRDYDHIDKEEAIRRIKILIVSLICCQGTVMTSFTNQIVTFLTTSLTQGYLKNSRFLYAQFMEFIVKPALNIIKKSPLIFTDFDFWLLSIDDESLFLPENNVCFGPEVLCPVIWAVIQKKEDQKLIIFFENILKIKLSSENLATKWIRAYIDFVNLLTQKKLPSDSSTQILYLLKAVKVDLLSQKKIYQASRAFLIHRLAAIGASINQTTLFGFLPGNYKKKYHLLKKALENKLDVVLELNKLDDPTIEEIIEMLTKCTTLSEQKNYLDKIFPFNFSSKPMFILDQPIGCTREISRL